MGTWARTDRDPCNYIRYQKDFLRSPERGLAPAFEREGIVLKFLSKETPGAAERSSRITVNGRSVEDLLREVGEEQRQCEGRRCEMGRPLTFPFVLRGDFQYLSVPELIIRKIFFGQSVLSDPPGKNTGLSGIG